MSSHDSVAERAPRVRRPPLRSGRMPRLLHLGLVAAAALAGPAAAIAADAGSSAPGATTTTPKADFKPGKLQLRLKVPRDKRRRLDTVSSRRRGILVYERFVVRGR